MECVGSLSEQRLRAGLVHAGHLLLLESNRDVAFLRWVWAYALTFACVVPQAEAAGDQKWLPAGFMAPPCLTLGWPNPAERSGCDTGQFWTWVLEGKPCILGSQRGEPPDVHVLPVGETPM